MLVPVGGGSGACGLITVRDALGLKTRIIGVGAERADAVARSWRTGTRVVGESADTFAEGVATRVTFDLTFGILQRGLDDFVLAERRGTRRRASGWRSISRTTWPKAPAAPHRSPRPRSARDSLRGQRVVCVMTRRQPRPSRCDACASCFAIANRQS